MKSLVVLVLIVSLAGCDSRIRLRIDSRSVGDRERAAELTEFAVETSRTTRVNWCETKAEAYMIGFADALRLVKDRSEEPLEEEYAEAGGEP